LRVTALKRAAIKNKKKIHDNIVVGVNGFIFKT